MKLSEVNYPIEMYSESGEGRLISARFHEGRMEIVQVTHGTVTVQIGTERIEAVSGDIFCVPEGVVYLADANGTAAALRGIIFDKAIIEDNMENYESEILYMFYVQSENKIQVFDKTHPAHAILTRCMDEAYEEFLLKEVCYKLPIRANVYLMMSALLRYYCGSKNELDRIIYHNVLRLRPVIQYISEHYAEKIYIESLAEKIMVSADYFTKMFKDSIGKTPVDYINGLRINRSMQLLITGDSSMSDIAEEIGFCNANYFHKIFKQYMDNSPLAYRKSNRAK